MSRPKMNWQQGVLNHEKKKSCYTITLIHLFTLKDKHKDNVIGLRGKIKHASLQLHSNTYTSVNQT